MAFFVRGDKVESINKETIRTEVKTEVQTLDYDKFLGTIGNNADRPVGAIKPHHTTFPSNPEEGGWLRVVSDVTINGKVLLNNDSWICVAKKTEGKEAVWEKTQEGAQKLVYPTMSRVVGEVRRLISDVPANKQIASSFYSSVAFDELSFSGIYANAGYSTAYITNISPIVAGRCRTDIYFRGNFQEDNGGKRTVSINLYAFYPLDENIYDLQLSRYVVDVDTVDPSSPLKTINPSVLFNTTEPFDDTPLVYGLTVGVFQTSGTRLDLISGILKLKSWS